MMAIILCLLGVSLAFFGKTPFFYWMFFAQSIHPFFEIETFTEQVMLLNAWSGAMSGSAYTFAGILMFFIITFVFPKKERWAYNAILIGLSAWYVINAGFNIYYKIYFKVITDSSFFFPVLVPIICIKNNFKKG